MSPQIIGDKLLSIHENRAGCVVATGAEFRVIGSGSIDDMVWATPAVANGSVFLEATKDSIVFVLRNEQYDVAGQDTAELRTAHDRLNKLKCRSCYGAQKIEIASFVRLQHMVDVQTRIASQMRRCRWLPSGSSLLKFHVIDQ